MPAADNFAATSLRHWIQPQHLRDDAIRALREQFAARPEGYVWLDDFLVPDRVAMLRRAAEEDGRLVTCYRLYGVPTLVDRERFEAADEAERLYHQLDYRGPKPGRETAPAIFLTAAFHLEIKGATFRAWLSRILGAPVGAMLQPMLTRLNRGHFVGWHTDVSHERTLCMVLYPHAVWEPRFGGCLLLKMQDGSIQAVEPRPNRVVLFNPATMPRHAVASLGDDIGEWGRLNYTAWYQRDGATTPLP